MNFEEENVENFKEKLYQSFGETGMMDQMKAQMRHKMIEKLVKSQKVQSVQAKHIAEKGQTKLLTQRLMASIVSEYLQRFEFNYTNSIFLPESGYTNKNLQRFEIFEILNSKSLENSSSCILESIIETYLTNTKNVPKTNCSTQTEHADAIFNLEQRLNTVDNKFRERFLDINTPSQEIEERLGRFKKDYENRLKAEMNAEIVRIREFEISTVRMEEQEKQRKQMTAYREEVEKTYADKLNKLRDRERETLDKCASKMKEIETVNHDHRQRILKDFELLRMREEEVDKQRHLNEETVKIQKQKIENYENELKEKIKKAEESQLIVEKKYQNDLAYTKLEAHRDLEAERLEIFEKKRILDEDMYKIKQMKDTVNQFTESNKKLSEENRKYTDELIELRHKRKEYELELSQLRDNLRSVSDSYKRDQDSTRNLEQKIKIKDEEIAFYKNALDESKKITDSHKQGSVDNMKKFNNEIQVYQDRIETLEVTVKEMKRISAETEFQLEQARRQVVVGGPQSHFASGPVTATLSRDISYYHSHQPSTVLSNPMKPLFTKEHEDLQLKRKQVLQELQKESDVVEKRNYNVKFENIWDVSNSSVDFSSLKQKHRNHELVGGGIGSVFDRTDVSKSQLYGDMLSGGRGGVTDAGNLIEESMREDYDYTKPLRESRESDPNNLSGSSRLRVLGDVERSRKESVNTKENNKDTGNFVIKKQSTPAGQSGAGGLSSSPGNRRESPSFQGSDTFKSNFSRNNPPIETSPVTFPSQLPRDTIGFGEKKKSLPGITSTLPSLVPVVTKKSDWDFQDIEEDFDDFKSRPSPSAAAAAIPAATESNNRWSSSTKPDLAPISGPAGTKKNILNPFGNTKKSSVVEDTDFDTDSYFPSAAATKSNVPKTQQTQIDYSKKSTSSAFPPVETKNFTGNNNNNNNNKKEESEKSISENYDDMDFEPIEEDLLSY